MNETAYLIPKVSVVMITYKHEEFIAEAIEGVLMQEVNFDLELIIADDCSPDKTEYVVREYVATNPKGHWIRYTRHKSNKGMMSNFIWALEQAKGQYIALCEGDDYWTDPLKLQKQVDFLERNKDYQACAHEVEILTHEGMKANKKKKNTYYVEDFFSESHLNTCSFLYRNNITLENQHFAAIIGDLVLFILCAKKGNIHFINETMAVYRMTGHGVYSGVKQKQQHLVKIFESLKAAFPEYKDEFQKTIHSKKKHNNLYPLNLLALLKGETPFEAFTYQAKNRVKKILKL